MDDDFPDAPRCPNCLSQRGPAGTVAHPFLVVPVVPGRSSEQLMSAADSKFDGMSQHWSPKPQVVATATPGRWFMMDKGARIAILQQLQIGTKKETMYRSVTFAEDRAERTLIGYFPHVEMAAEITWREYLKAKNRELVPQAAH